MRQSNTHATISIEELFKMTFPKIEMQETCEIVWQTLKRLITSQFTFGRTLLIFDSFYISEQKLKGFRTIKLTPTQNLIAQCGLTYRDNMNQILMGIVTNLTDHSLYKHIQSEDRDLVTKEACLKVLQLVFRTIRELLKTSVSIHLSLDLLGTIHVYQKSFFHQAYFHSKEKLQINGMVSSSQRSKASIFRNKSSMNKQALPLQAKLSANNNKPSFLQKYNKSWCKFNPLKSPLFVPDTRIPDELLGAGLDPLTYDYVHSTLVGSESLLTQEFTKPNQIRMRHPGVIDRFARTLGCPLTGTKVSNSIVVRIGSNYTPFTKNIYIDLKTKAVAYAPPEIKIKLNTKILSKNIIAADEDEQYGFVMTGKEQLRQKVNVRIFYYDRYVQYLQNSIPNSSVAPISQQKLNRILVQNKRVCQNIGSQAISKINKLINQINLNYYKAYKKSVLDYILIDNQEKQRIGVPIIFGRVLKMRKHIQTTKQTREMIVQTKKYLEERLLNYPQLLLQVSFINRQILNSDILKIRESECRLTNVLYFVKKQMNTMAETLNLLRQGWVLKVVNMICQNIDIETQINLKLQSFLRSVDIIMSNTLKDLILNFMDNLHSFFKHYEKDSRPYPILLQLNLTEQNGKIIFCDDLSLVFRQEMVNIVPKLLSETANIVSVTGIIKDIDKKLSSICPNDQSVLYFTQSVLRIIDLNLVPIQREIQNLRNLQLLFPFKDQIFQWLKGQISLNEVDEKINKLNSILEQVDAVPFFISHRLAVIDCTELKKKLWNSIKYLKTLIFQTLEDRSKRLNLRLLAEQEQMVRNISYPIQNTQSYLKVSTLLDNIKSTQIIRIKNGLNSVTANTLKLCSMGNGYLTFQFYKQLYKTHQLHQNLPNILKFHTTRLVEEKLLLEKILRQKIAAFNTYCESFLRKVQEELGNLSTRKSYQEYKLKIQVHVKKVKELRKSIQQLNKQQQDLGWNITNFEKVNQINNLTDSNYQLWSVVQKYDLMMKEWRTMDLCAMDIIQCQKKIAQLEIKLPKLLKKLKNFNALKIAHELHNDIRQISSQQLPIIKIFSHPGLKDRHWHLFNKKLMIPGFDLKQIPYAKIRILYDYQKNLKVLMSISNQAAKQYQIQNEKNEMQNYWAKVSIQIEDRNKNYIKISEKFLHQNLSILQNHLVRIQLMKSSPFSKVLINFLAEFEGWLFQAESALSTLQQSQSKYISLKKLINHSQLSKQPSIDWTEFDIIQNIWKSIIKRINEQSKFSDFSRNPKIMELLIDISKKIQLFNHNIHAYLNLKRMEFPRLYFLDQSQLIQILVLLNRTQTQIQGIKQMFQRCFNGIANVRISEDAIIIKSRIDQIKIKVKNEKRQNKWVIDWKNVLMEIKAVIKEQINECLTNQKEIYKQKKTINSLKSSYSLMYTKSIELSLCKNKLRQEIGNIRNNIQEIIKFREGLKIQQSKVQIVKADILVAEHLFWYERVLNLDKQQSTPNTIHQFSYLSLLKFYQNINHQIFVQAFNYSIQYQYQYLGHHVQGYKTHTTEKYTCKLISSISQGFNSFINGHSNLCLRFAQQCGRYMAIISDQFVKVILEQQNNLGKISNNMQSLMVGLAVGGIWVVIPLNGLQKFNDVVVEGFYNILGTHLSQILKKSKENEQHICINQKIYKINNQSKCFINLPINSSLQIPQSLKNSFRITSILLPDLSILLKNKCQELHSLLISVNKGSNYNLTNVLMDTLRDYCDPIRKWDELVTEIDEGSFPLSLEGVPQDCIGLMEDYRKTIKKLETEKVKKQKIIWNYNFDELKQSTKQLIIHAACYQEKSGLIIYGQSSCKSQIIKQLFKNNPLLFSNKIIPICFPSSNQLQQYIRKVLKQLSSTQQTIKLTEINDKIAFCLAENELNSTQIQILSQQNMNYLFNCSSNRDINIKFKTIIEVHCLQSLSPCMINKFNIQYVDLDKLNFNQVLLRKSAEIKKEIDLKKQQINTIQSLVPLLQNLIQLVQRMKKNKWEENKKFNKFLQIKRFYEMFRIYLLHLKSKQVEAIDQFNTILYINQSFIFSAYWTFGVLLLQERQLRSLQNSLMQMVVSQIDFEGDMLEYYLNQQNQWVTWQSMTEQFTYNDHQKIPIYNLWVPTTNNTRIYTMAIKFLQNNTSLTICGTQCGKSTFLKQVCNFQSSYHSFLLDCHSKTKTKHFYSWIKDKIFHTTNIQNLILVDDLNLPLEQNSLSALLKQVIENQCLPNLSLKGSTSYPLKKTALFFTIRQPSTNIFLHRLINCTTLFPLPTLQDKEIQTIFQSYYQKIFENQPILQIITKLDLTTIQVVLKIIRMSEKQLNIKDLRNVIETMLCLNPIVINERQKYVYMMYQEVLELIKAKITNEEIAKAMEKVVYDECSKIISVNFLEKSKQFLNYKSQYGDCSVNQICKEWEQILNKDGQLWIIGEWNVKQLLKVVNHLRNSASHLMLVGERGCGGKSLIKMARLILGINLKEVVNVQNFRSEILSLIKTGGKVDECICLLGNKIDIVNRESLLVILNSIVGSPELNELFSQIQIQQIIKSFNVDKKFIKKDIKNSELIKKIREKVNFLYHSVIISDYHSISQIKLSYPSLCHYSKWLRLNQWPKQAYLNLSIQFLPNIADSILSIRHQILTSLGCKNIYSKISTFKSFFQVFTNMNKYFLQKKTKMNALDQLLRNRLNSTKENGQYLKNNLITCDQNIEEYQNLVKEYKKEYQVKQLKLKQLKSEYQKSQVQYQKAKCELKEVIDSIKEQILSFQLQLNKINSQIDKKQSEKQLANISNNEICKLLKLLSIKDIEGNNRDIKTFTQSVKLRINTFYHNLSSQEYNIQINQIDQIKLISQSQFQLAQHDSAKNQVKILKSLVLLCRQITQKSIIFKNCVNKKIKKQQEYFEIQQKFRDIDDTIDEVKDEIAQKKQGIKIKLMESQKIKLEYCQYQQILRLLNTVMDFKNNKQKYFLELPQENLTTLLVFFGCIFRNEWLNNLNNCSNCFEFIFCHKLYKNYVSSLLSLSFDNKQFVEDCAEFKLICLGTKYIQINWIIIDSNQLFFSQLSKVFGQKNYKLLNGKNNKLEQQLKKGLKNGDYILVYDLSQTNSVAIKLVRQCLMNKQQVGLGQQVIKVHNEARLFVLYKKNSDIPTSLSEFLQVNVNLQQGFLANSIEEILKQYTTQIKNNKNWQETMSKILSKGTKFGIPSQLLNLKEIVSDIQLMNKTVSLTTKSQLKSYQNSLKILYSSFKSFIKPYAFIEIIKRVLKFNQTESKHVLQQDLLQIRSILSSLAFPNFVEVSESITNFMKMTKICKINYLLTVDEEHLNIAVTNFYNQTNSSLWKLLTESQDHYKNKIVFLKVSDSVCARQYLHYQLKLLNKPFKYLQTKQLGNFINYHGILIITISAHAQWEELKNQMEKPKGKLLNNTNQIFVVYTFHNEPEWLKQEFVIEINNLQLHIGRMNHIKDGGSKGKGMVNFVSICFGLSCGSFRNILEQIEEGSKFILESKWQRQVVMQGLINIIENEDWLK